MATLSDKEQKKSKRKRKRVFFVTMVCAILIAPWMGELLDKTLYGVLTEFGAFHYDFRYLICVKEFGMHRQRIILVLIFYVVFFGWIYITEVFLHPKIATTETVEVAQGISMPVAVGNGQYGTARFMTETEMSQEFEEISYSKRSDAKKILPEAGVIVDYKKIGKKEVIKYLTQDVNVEILAPTRMGKTRRVLLTSIWLNLLAGVNMFVTDVKGEICAYTSPFAKQCGYDVRILDYRYFEKSMHFNNLNEIIELLSEGKVSEAVDKAWDIVTILVGEAKGERIWTDGQCATITAAILIVAQDAPEGCKNLPNVYYFLAYMCESDPETGKMPINEYLDNLPYNHPARGAFQIAKIAPFRTRSSFFTSALATLRLFTTWTVADIAQKSDFRLDDVDDKKVIFYFILPDEKKTYHPLGALFLKQLYESLVHQALRKGGVLDRKFIFKADEIGNFPVIPEFGTMLSAGAGRNIFFELVLQEYQQMEAKYKEEFRNIHSNCQLTICLRATDDKTTQSLSKRMGTYTVQVNSVTSNQSSNNGKSDSASYGSSSNMTGRPLMYESDISKLTAPDALLLFGGNYAIVNLPDISVYYANKDFGMGSKNHNKKLFLQRIAERPSRIITEPKLWGIWKDYGAVKIVDEDIEEEKVSFL